MRIQITILSLLLLASPVALAAPGQRDAAVAALQGLVDAAGSEAVRVVVNDGSGRTIRIGDELAYRFDARRAGYLTAVHIDVQGATTLLYPRASVEAGRLEAGASVSFPATDDPFTLEVKPPVGRDVVFAFLTDEPIDRGSLGIEDDGIVVAYEPQQAADFVERLRRALAARGEGRYAAHVINQQVDGRGAVQYRSMDIVSYFGERTRSIAPPKLDLQIHFGTDSAELDEQAQRNIDEFAVALDDPLLRSMRFAVVGHTDDRGPEAHNEDLSRRRAVSVKRYLVERGGIAADRLEIEAQGEKSPLIDEQTSYARQMNRRVEFTLIRK